MSIEPIVLRSRLWSCDKKDTKPEGWAPGILMLELDTGIWWITDDQRQWQPCYVSAAAHAALAGLVGEMKTKLDVAEARLAALERLQGPPGGAPGGGR